ncbi:MAG TPA: hypothetical protein VHO69_09075 [Phototrophicaceae bacterium]|nr:hypothetical protein [Phototrophicaceae bacterium]
MPLQPNNPILRRELLYQERHVPRWLWRVELVGVVAVPLLLTPFLIMNSLKVDEFGSSYTPPRYSTLQLLVTLIWTIHALTAIRVVTAGSHTINRDFQGQAWDDIRLTGVTIWQVLFGKWWATLHRVRGWMVALGIAQIIVVPVIMAEFSFHACAYTFSDLVYCMKGVFETTKCVSMAQNSHHWRSLYTPGEMPAAVIIAVSFSTIETLSCAAIGLAAGTIIRSETIATLTGILIRFLPVLAFSFIPDYSNASGFLLWRWQEYTWFALADGGTTAVLRIADPWGANRELLAVLAGSGLFLFYLAGSVELALVVLRWRGASVARNNQSRDTSGPEKNSVNDNRGV